MEVNLYLNCVIVKKNEILLFGNIMVDRRKHQVFVGCELKKTNEVECCIVEYLCTRGGTTAMIEAITSYVLNNVNGASRNMVRRSIYELRRSLVDANGRTYI